MGQKNKNLHKHLGCEVLWSMAQILSHLMICRFFSLSLSICRRAPEVELVGNPAASASHHMEASLCE